MKVLIVNKYLYPKGGDAVCALFTGEQLQRRGHSVHYWGMSDPRNPQYPDSDLFIPIIDYYARVSSFTKAREAISILYNREAKKRFRKMLARVRPDIVHLHNFAHQISPSILHVLHSLGIPAVMTMHDYKLVCPVYKMLSQGELCERCRSRRYYHCVLRVCTMGSITKSLVNAMEMYIHHCILHIYENISRFLAPSAFLAEKVREMGFRGQIEHIPNALDTSLFRPEAKSLSKEFVCFGRLSGEKGVRTLIEAVLRSKDARLKIIGDGPLKAELEEKVRSSGCDRIHFLGYLSGETLYAEVRNSLAVVIPSEWYENCPMSVLESFALGKPVIGARIGGIPELVRDGVTGTTFTAGDASDLRNKMEAFLQNASEATRMGQAARALVEEEYNPGRYYDRLLTVYESVLSEKTGSVQ
jgi:glycosyltransferase involved in cell wall biosynthesis